MSINNHYYSIMSGLFGSLASLFGKSMNYNFTSSKDDVIACVKQHRALYDHSDQNYKNSVYVDKAWQSVSKEFGEDITNCKKKWRHLRSSLSRYLKSSKDLAKNKNKLKPYYLLQHMDFLVPYTKTLEMKTESVINKYEPADDAENFAEMKSEEQSAYEHEIIQEESQSMEDEEDIVYEAYEIHTNEPLQQSSTSQNQKSQITLVRTQNNPQTTTIPQLHTISPASTKPPAQLQLNSTQISQQQQQSPATQSLQPQQQQIPLQNTIIPISDDQSSADLNFFLALLPDVRNMTQDQKRRLRIGTLKLIDEILNCSH